MNIEQKIKLSAAIQYDINRGLYEAFPTLKKDLERIAEKILQSAYIVNEENTLTLGDKKILASQTYIVI